jgi:2-hydroxy-6-oxonona-2,4-dienedioate hydrolase
VKRRLALLVLLGGLVILAGITIVMALSEAAGRRTELSAQSRLLETPQGTLEFVSWGAGPPVLVLHGAGGGFDQGRLLAESIGAGGYTWIAVSRFGYLRSELPQDASTAAQADALASLLDALGYDRASVLAMSGGAPPALQLAARHPERVRAMVLLSPAPFTPFSPDVGGRPVPTAFYSALAGNDILYWLMKTLARGQLEAAFDARPELVRRPEDRVFVRQLIDGFLPASGRAAGISNEAAAVDPQAVYPLETITAPVLVVHAGDDRLNPVTVGETIAARIPGADFLRLDSGGHLLLGAHQDLQVRIAGFLSPPDDTP